MTAKRPLPATTCPLRPQWPTSARPTCAWSRRAIRSGCARCSRCEAFAHILGAQDAVDDLQARLRSQGALLHFVRASQRDQREGAVEKGAVVLARALDGDGVDRVFEVNVAAGER